MTGIRGSPKIILLFFALLDGNIWMEKDFSPLVNFLKTFHINFINYINKYEKTCLGIVVDVEFVLKKCFQC